MIYKSVAERLAHLVQARINCLARSPVNSEWAARHEERAELLVRNNLPSGSGFDNGTQLDWDRSTGDKLVFNTSFHHMDDGGGYCGWSDHTVTVVPSFIGGFTMRIGGRNVRDIKEYIGQAFESALSRRYNDTEEGPDPREPAE